MMESSRRDVLVSVPLQEMSDVQRDPSIPTVLDMLRQLGERVEIRDETGQLAGYFTPPVAIAPTPACTMPWRSRSPMTSSIASSRSRAVGPLDEILADLEKRS